MDLGQEYEEISICVILNAWKFIKMYGFGDGVGVYELIFGEKEGKYIQETF